MESNWRQNVPVMGMACSDWELSARYVHSPDLFIVKDKRSPPFYCSVWQWFGINTLPVYVGGVFKLAPHFPYGYEVEPDLVRADEM